jgi:hypothetical protein
MNFKIHWPALLTVLVSVSVAAAQNTAVSPTDGAKVYRSQFFNWAKVRMDEIDAILAAWEGQVAKLPGEARAKGEAALANIRAKRDAFRETIQKDMEQIKLDWDRERAAREADWKVFEANAQKYIDDASAQAEQQRAAFRARAEAQQKAWQEAIDKLQQDAAKATAEGKAKMDTAIQRMRADAAAAQAKLEKLKSAGDASWSAYGKALEETRSAFDRAAEAAHDAFTK